MRLTVKLYATLKDRAKTNQVTVELEDGATIGTLRERLAADYAALASTLPRCLAAINQEFADDEAVIRPGAEVAFFPPVSGGTNFPTITRITADALDLHQVAQGLTLPTTGAVVLFTGAVRGSEQNRQVMQLYYEAYTPMAEAKLRQVADEMRDKFPDIEGIALIQRVGLMAAGETTIVVAVSSPHRDQGCFEAARYGIDRIKEIVPVWKKEIGPGTLYAQGRRVN
jgi:molybdopterin converting factor subunit 1